MIHTCLQTKAQPTGRTPITSETAQLNHDVSAGLHPGSDPSPATGGVSPTGTGRAWQQSKLFGFQGLYG